ncbi:hypothetical protein NX862_13765 [Rhodobacter sp. KR11]|uniref:hypothetical protein n=1 Tax=Rhodobacter sp. KR11 TaxID=2974588 RepID=UPI0022224F55|nr:hypothetical protein [Rhodobacter sp. KR11]MCW1919823.1 hypothetical protein [Rhodobacter sp. KR11]
MRILNQALTLFPLLVVLPALALADPPPALPAPDLGAPLTGAEFEAYATGKTLTYSDGGAVWGQEQYLPGHQVIWAFADAPCQFGSWSEASGPGGPMLCFTYDDKPEDVNCWQFYRGPQGLVAQFMEGGAALSELGQSDQPMQCPGPEVGA